MSNRINKKAGFWVRFGSLIIDLILFCSIGISSSLFCLKKEIILVVPRINIYQVRNDFTYFLWLLLLIVLITIQFILIPILSNGKTIGMIITKLDIEFYDKNRYKSILKKIEIGPFIWIVLICLFMCFVWPKTINKMVIFSYIKAHFSESNQNQALKDLLDKNKWTLLETVFYTIPSALSPMILLIQLFFLISVGFRGNKTSLVDKFSNSQVVYKNKFIDVENTEIKLVKPIKNEIYQINWRD